MWTFQRTSHVNYPDERPTGLLSRREAKKPTHDRKGAVAMWRLELGSSRIQFEQLTQEIMLMVVMAVVDVIMMMMMVMVVMIMIMLRLL